MASEPDLSSLIFRKKCTAVLRKYFGHREFRENQFECVQALLSGRDALIVMHTGSGKSLCYQMPPLISDRPCIVISPLISLMNDQILALRQRGIGAMAIHSESKDRMSDLITRMTESRQRDNPKVPKSERILIVYMSPERVTDRISEIGMIRDASGGLSCIAVDESHCISEWGFDFRTSYQVLSKLRLSYPDIPIVALTATATPRVRNDIIRSLNLRESDLFRGIGSFNRPNLTYKVLSKTKSVLSDLQPLLFPSKSGRKSTISSGSSSDRGSTIIYCLTKNDCNQISNVLSNTRWIQCGTYHSSMTPKQKQQTLADFKSGVLECVVATIAFGMGIDKADIRRVIHYGMPKSVEGYLQQCGRAGRDGQPSQCTLLWSRSDIITIRNIQSKGGTTSISHSAEVMVQNMHEYVTLPADRCRRRWLLEYMGEKYTKSTTNLSNSESNCCDNCSHMTSLLSNNAHGCQSNDPNISSDSASQSLKRDYTVEARAIARAVYDTGNRFGQRIPVKLMRGSQAKDLETKLRFKGDYRKLSSYGVWKSRSDAWVTAMFEHMTAIKVIQRQLVNGYSVIKLAELGFRLLNEPHLTLPPSMPSIKLAKLERLEFPDVYRRRRKSVSQMRNKQDTTTVMSTTSVSTGVARMSVSDRRFNEFECDDPLDLNCDSNPSTSLISQRKRNFSAMSAGENASDTGVSASSSSNHRSSQTICIDPGTPSPVNRARKKGIIARLIWKPITIEHSNPLMPRMLPSMVDAAGLPVTEHQSSDDSGDSHSSSAATAAASAAAICEDLSSSLMNDESELFDFLVSLRHRLSIKVGMATYRICTDGELRSMARVKPTTAEQLRQDCNIPASFISRYGRLFVSKIQQWSNQNSKQDSSKNNNNENDKNKSDECIVKNGQSDLKKRAIPLLLKQVTQYISEEGEKMTDLNAVFRSAKPDNLDWESTLEMQMPDKSIYDESLFADWSLKYRGISSVIKARKVKRDKVEHSLFAMLIWGNTLDWNRFRQYDCPGLTISDIRHVFALISKHGIDVEPESLATLVRRSHLSTFVCSLLLARFLRDNFDWQPM